MSQTLVIPARYCGPPQSGNGGWCAGALAGFLSEGRANSVPVAVDLRQPPPLDATMKVDRHDEALILSFGGAVIAEAREVAELGTEPPGPLSYDEAASASEAFPGFEQHPFPTCFSCGPEREDGLRIFPGPVAHDTDLLAAPWTPHPSVAADPPTDAPADPSADPSAGDDPDGPATATLAATWSALDCIGGWAGGFGVERTMVLARMTACVDELPIVGEQHVVVGRHLGTEGRKTRTSSAILDSDGRVVGLAEHLWIAVDPARFHA